LTVLTSSIKLLKLIEPRFVVFAVLFCGRRIAVISEKPYKIRRMTMKNFVESLLNFVKITVNYLVKNQMLKWERQGGGG
jgi:hypothetical protein